MTNIYSVCIFLETGISANTAKIVAFYVTWDKMIKYIRFRLIQ